MKRRKTRSSLAVVTVLGMLLALLPLTAVSAQAVSSDLIITGVVDGPLSGGVPKAIEVYVVNDIADLSAYGLGSANNGGGTDGQEFTFPADSASAGEYLCVGSEAAGFDSFFGFAPDYTSSAANVNGDDAIELFKDAAVVDVFGDINTDGTGQPWEYLDGWAARLAGTGPDGSTFAIANWTFSGANALDGETTNATAASPFLIGCDGPPPPPPAPDVDTAIYDIQFTPGPGGDSPLVGQTVVTEGVATAVFFDGAFIQDGQGPWSGLWLFGPSVMPEVGDLVRVQGEVSEFFGMTQVGGGTTWIVGTGDVPTPEILASGDISQEMWEAVFVRAEDAVVDNPDLGFGEWSIDDGSGPVRVDDKGDYTYEPVAADPVGYLQGPLDYSFSNFKIQPRDDFDIYAGLVVCGADFTPIYDIQGNSWSSPLDGSQVWTEGVVTADFQMSSQLSAFYIQDPVGDGDGGTSDGVMVYHRDTWDYDVSVGEHVRLLATVDEFFGLTQLGNVANLSVCGAGSIAPTPVDLPLNDIERESLEGMYVTFPQSLNIIEFFNFDRFGEFVLGNGRQFQPTNVFEPGSTDAVALAAANEVNQLRVDDARGGQNQDPAIHPNGLPFTLDNRFRGGDLVANVTGVLDYAFGDYKVQPTQGADYTAINPRTDAPEFAGDTVRVAAFNVLNFFTHYDDGTNDVCGPLGINECRGADTDLRFTDPDFVYESEEYPRQRDKIVAGIIGLDADVVGLMEIENDIRDDEPVYPNQAHDPVIQLVAALNAAEAAAGSGYTWDWDVADYYNNYPVRNEIIYRNTVTPYGPPVALQDLAFDGVRERSDGTLGTDPVGRPPVAQSFADANGEGFTVVANHFKSKGSGCDDGVFDPVTGDLLWLDPGSDNGQGNCPLTRVMQSKAMMAWLATDPTGVGDPDVLIIGDLNSYTMEDPIDVIEAAGYSNLVKHYEGMDAYSYVFDGQLGNLDHALGSASIVSQVTGTAAWHINSDEPDILDYDTSFKKDAQDALYEPNAYRASDHDPVIVGLNLGVQIEASPDSLWPPNHQYEEVLVTATSNAGRPLTVVITGVASSEDDSGYGKGDKPDDVGDIDGEMVELRAERYTGYGRTYTIYVNLFDGPDFVTSGMVEVVVPHDQREKKPKKN